MKAKRQLKNNRKYSYVFIENDKSYEQRLYEANNKKLLNLIGTKDHIVKGGRILRIQDIW
jgi:hypothetical protein